MRKKILGVGVAGIAFLLLSVATFVPVGFSTQIFEKPSAKASRTYDKTLLDKADENTVTCSDETSLEENNTSLPIKVTVKVLRGLRLCFIRVSVVNLENKHLTLDTRSPGGGFVVYNSDGKEICRKPNCTIMMLYPISLKPHQRKILFRGIWIVPNVWKMYTIYGELFAYRYKEENYPSLKSSPVTIYPWARALR